MKKAYSFLIFIFWACNGYSQDGHQYIVQQNEIIDQYIDSLKYFPKHDTLRVLALQKIYNIAIFKSQKEKVLPYAKEAIAISKKLDYKIGMCYYYVWQGRNSVSNFDSKNANIYFDSIYFIKPPYPPYYKYYCGFTEQMRGEMYKNQENYYKALKHFFLALNFYKENTVITQKKEPHILRVYNLISQVYYKIENLENAETHAKLTITSIDKEKFVFNNVDPSILKSYGSDAKLLLVDIYIKQHIYNKALDILKSFRQMSENDSYYFASFNYFQKLGSIYFTKKEYDSAYANFKKAHYKALENKHSEMSSNSLTHLTQTALKLGKLDEAKTYAEENIALAKQDQHVALTIEALKSMAEYKSAIGDNALAFKMMQEASILKDSLISETNLKQINTLNVIYQSEQDKEAISKLNAANEKKATINKILIGSSAGLLLIGFMGYRNFRNSRKLQNLKIAKLEKDKQLSAIDAMLKGQEEERNRIAKDLHDGLGGLLSGTKLSFATMKENLILSPEHAEQFEKSLGMLDTTIVDLRKVAHNLMPEALSKFGLYDALRDYCNTVQSSTDIQINYQKFGIERKLSNTAEVFIYRIIQELVTNALKHAEASEIIVQLAVEPNKVFITIEDNGKGYDTTNLTKLKGDGLENIKYRVQYLKGNIDTVSSPNHGTSVNIELNA